MSDYESRNFPGEEQQQIEVFGAERMAMLAGHEASPEVTNAFLHTVGAIAIESGSSNHSGMVSRSLQVADGHYMGVQLNPNGIRGFGSSEEDAALATVYGLKNEKRWVLVPGRLWIGEYEINETMYVGRDNTARIFKRITPLQRGTLRDLITENAKEMSARKPATEDEVSEALDLIVSAVRYNDTLGRDQ